MTQEEIDARKKAKERDKIIKREFNNIEKRVSGVIKKERKKILSYFGPLVQQKKKSAYTILGDSKKKVDLSARTKICLPFSVKIKMLRCVKDKVQSGVYVVLAEIKDRIGGTKIAYDYTKNMQNLEKMKGRIREYEQLKLRFLKEQKIEVSTAESEGLLEKENNDDHSDHEDNHSHKMLHSEGSDRSQKNSNRDKKELDPNLYEELTFVKGYSKFRNFHGVYDDDEFFVDENCYLLYPPINRARPSMIIEFKLIKLSSETSLDDEIVGWGVFPLLNSELEFNEGRFKIPILHGEVDEEITLYRQIQSKMIENLDVWLCNMYFEVEPLLIQKLEFDYEHEKMFIEKIHLNKQHGAKIFKERTYNVQDIEGEQARVSLIHDGQSKKSSLGANEETKSNRKSALNLVASIPPDALSRHNSKTILNREEKNFANSLLNEEEQQLKRQLEIDLRDGLDDDTLMLESYSFSVSDKFNYETRNIAKKKMVYIFTEALSDLGVKSMNSVAFQLTLFVIILAFWSRMYLHYFGEYVSLLMMGIPVTIFQPKWWTVHIHYEASVGYQEMIVISFGVLFNTFLFGIFTLGAYLIKRYIGELPGIFYKMI